MSLSHPEPSPPDDRTAAAGAPADAPRPRERLLRRGPSALADAEVLALLLGTGRAGMDVLQCAQQLLTGSGGFAGLMAAEPQGLTRWPGLGPAKAAQLVAAFEMARRAVGQRLRESPVFEASAALKDYALLHWSALPHEVFALLLLDHRHRLLHGTTLFRGTLSQTSVYPREVVKEALAHNAGAVILVHNHPSGVAEPSTSDLALTQQLQAALRLVDVRVLDHLVVGRGEVVSMAERGWI